MSEINTHSLDQAKLNKMIADYLRNRELGNLTISRILQEKISLSIKVEQLRKDVIEVEETLRLLSEIFIEIEN